MPSTFLCSLKGGKHEKTCTFWCVLKRHVQEKKKEKEKEKPALSGVF
jgi:hypothetical protein